MRLSCDFVENKPLKNHMTCKKWVESLIFSPCKPMFQNCSLVWCPGGFHPGSKAAQWDSGGASWNSRLRSGRREVMPEQPVLQASPGRSVSGQRMCGNWASGTVNGFPLRLPVLSTPWKVFWTLSRFLEVGFLEEEGFAAGWSALWLGLHFALRPQSGESSAQQVQGEE